MGAVKPSVLAIAVSIFLVGGAASAAPRGKPPTTPNTRTTSVRKLSSTDILVSQLFQNKYRSGEHVADACRRANFKNLAIALSMNIDLLTRERGEFETSEQYEERSNKLAEILSGDPVVICTSLNDDVAFSYHADQQLFDGSFPDSINIWRDAKNLGAYRTKTRMGIPVTVKSSVVMEYNLSLSLPSELQGCLAGSYSYKFQVPVKRDAAPLLKSLGRLVVLAKLVPPYIGKEFTPGNPTLDNPYDINTHTITPHVRPEKLIIVDPLGNEVWSCRVGARDPLQPPLPLGNQSTWAGILDYPRGGFRENQSGTVSAILQIANDGKVSACKVASSSGYPELDQATCAAWIKNAKFIPASDNDGNPTVGEYSITKTWTRYGF